jgi:hypothetical protein
MEGTFALAADDNRRSQNSQRSKTRSWNGCRNSSKSPSSRRNSRDGGGGKTPYEGGDTNHNDGNGEDFHTGDKGPTMNTPRPTNENKTVIVVQRRTMLSIQKRGVTTITQGWWDEHTTSPLGGSNEQSHPTQGESNLWQGQHHQPCP